jgi:PIN domain nuclease of toxin-antitoxin system
MPVVLEHVLGVANLPLIHKDPFDRLLVSQAVVEGADLVSADQVVRQYPVRVFW